MSKSEVQKVYRGIWYRDNAPKERSLEDAFKRDRGKLLIGDKSIEYAGKKTILRSKIFKHYTLGCRAPIR